MRIMLLLAALAVLLVSTAPAKVILNERVQLSGTIPNPCVTPPEIVTIEGEIHVVIEETVVAKKHRRWVTMNVHGKGVSNTGNEYIFNETHQEILVESDVPQPFISFEGQEWVRLVARGKTPNWRVLVRIRIYCDFVNPPVIEPLTETSDCQ